MDVQRLAVRAVRREPGSEAEREQQIEQIEQDRACRSSS